MFSTIALIGGSLVFVFAGLLVPRYWLVALPIFAGSTWLVLFSATQNGQEGPTYFDGLVIPPITIVWTVATVIAVAVGRRFPDPELESNDQRNS